MSTRTIVLIVVAAVGAAIAVPVVWLAVIFLMPAPAAMMKPDPAEAVVGHAGDQPLTVNDLRHAAVQVHVLGALGITIPQQIAPDDPARWWALAKHDARMHHVTADQAKVDEAWQALSQQPDALDALRRQYNIDDQRIREVLEDWLAAFARIEQLVDEQMPDEAQLAKRAQALADQATFRLTPIPTALMLKDVPEPTDEEVAEQFARYRDNVPGESQPHGFGYRLPARVKLEYITVSREAVAGSIKVTEMDAARFYSDHQHEFGDEDGKLQTFEVALPQIKAQLERSAAQEKQGEIISWLESYTHQTRREGQASLDEVAQEAERRYGVLPTVVRLHDRLRSVAELVDPPGFGAAMVATGGRAGPQFAPVTMYIASCRELNPPEDHPLRPLRLAVNELSQPVRDMDGNFYLFRITEARPPETPASPDDVRSDVVRDLKKLAAYRKTKDLAAHYAATGIAPADLAAEVAAEMPDAEKPFELGPISRHTLSVFRQIDTPMLPHIGRDEQLLDDLFAMTDPLGRSPGIDPLPAAERRKAAASNRTMTVHLAELIDWQPADAEQLDTARQVARAAEQQRLLPLVVSLEALTQRTSYVPAP